MARYRILIVTLTTAYVVPAGSDIPTKPRQKTNFWSFSCEEKPRNGKPRLLFISKSYYFEKVEVQD